MSKPTLTLELWRDYILSVLEIEKNNVDSDYIERYLKLLDSANKTIKAKGNGK